MLKTVLQKIGLTEKDAEVYLACLELGTQPASVIAKKASLKRPTTYLILEALVKKGLVSEYVGSNVKYFTAVSPEYLLNFVEKKRRELNSHQRELEQLLPQFQNLTNPYSLSPKVRFYDGIEGIERVMNDTFTTNEPIRCFTHVDAWFSNQATKDYILWYGKHRTQEKGMDERAIAIDTPTARKYLEEDYPDIEGKQHSFFRWLPKDIQVFQNEINIYDNKMSIVCITPKELLAVLIESEGIASTQKSIFEVAWRTALPGKRELEKLKNGHRNGLKTKEL